MCHMSNIYRGTSSVMDRLLSDGVVHSLQVENVSTPWEVLLGVSKCPL